MKRTRRNKPMSLIVLGNNKTPVGSKISVIGWLKGNLNMTHTGTFYFREGKRNPMTMLPPTYHFFFKMLFSHDISWQKAQHKWINDPGHFSQ